MRRTGLTNFLIWALATVPVTYFFVGLSAGGAVLVAAVAFAVAWWTRFWPEALGLATGTGAVCLLSALQALGNTDCPPGGYCGPRPWPYLVSSVVIAIGAFVIWRQRTLDHGAASPAPVVPPGRRNGTSGAVRLSIATVLGALVLLVVNGLMLIVFGLRCGSDTEQATPGSDRAAYCDFLHGRDELVSLLVFAPPAVALFVGLVAARRRDSRLVLCAIIGGLAAVVALHIPDWVLSNSA